MQTKRELKNIFVFAPTLNSKEKYVVKWMLKHGIKLFVVYA